MSGPNLSLPPDPEGDRVLDALTRSIELNYGGDVHAALGDTGSRCASQPSGEWSAEATLLALIDYRIARLEWSQAGRRGPRPKPLIDVTARLKKLGMLPDDGGTAEVPA